MVRPSLANESRKGVVNTLTAFLPISFATVVNLYMTELEGDNQSSKILTGKVNYSQIFP